MPEPQTIADAVSGNIRGAMARRRKLQTDVGTALGLGQQAVSARLAGTVRWSVVEVVEVARLLDVPLSELVPDELTDAQP